MMVSASTLLLLLALAAYTVWELWQPLAAGAARLLRELRSAQAAAAKALDYGAVGPVGDEPSGRQLARAKPPPSPGAQLQEVEGLLAALVDYLDRRRSSSESSESLRGGSFSSLRASVSAVLGGTGGHAHSAGQPQGGDAAEAAQLHASLLAAQASLLELVAERARDVQAVLYQSGVSPDVRAFITGSYLAGSSGDGARRRQSSGYRDASDSLKGPSRLSDVGSDGGGSGLAWVREGDDDDGRLSRLLNAPSSRRSSLQLSRLEPEPSTDDERRTLRRRTDLGNERQSPRGEALKADQALKKVNPDVKTAGINFSFDTLRLKHSSSPLLEVMPQILRTMELDATLNSGDIRKFLIFVARVAKGYHSNNFYHNEIHAADVTCRLCAIMYHCGIKDRPMDMLPAVIAAIIHDYDHPGTSNNFHVAVQSEHALRWNNQAVLENHSLEACLAIMEQEECDFMGGFSDKQRGEVRAKIITLVLATDLSKHFETVEQFRKKVLAKVVGGGMQDASPGKLRDVARRSNTQQRELAMKSDRKLYRKLDAPERLLVLQMAMKVADIGHCSTPLGQHLQWLQRLEDEMFLQGDLEAKLQLPVSMFMDRHKPGVFDPANQEGFFLAVVDPTVQLWTSVFQSSEPLLRATQQNLRYWSGKLPIKPGPRGAQGK